ncbi:Hydrolase-4 domain-containing protein [Mycena venus]|uniref:Hydrolase-4 domain-containing protein n=1 Tax=Mycena venus TaxID=2733690 RepID=A0A8H6XTB3_9AGAR|nr:Hydrolase-4 domain-containing protein [Mycena venus]
MSTRLQATRVAITLAFIVALLNLYLLVASTGKDRSPQYHDYSYIGDDYPELWEISSTQSVAMMVEETRSYPMDGGPNAREIWATSSSKGFGYVRLGSEHRAFAISMFHQLHCMRLIHAALAGRAMMRLPVGTCSTASIIFAR